MLKLSLRSLLALVAMVAVAIVSLRFATEGWSTAVLTISLITFWVAAIAAVVDRGVRQSIAIGFAMSMAIYGVILLSVSLAGTTQYDEFNPATGRLITTRLLNPIYRAVADVRWFDFTTGKEVLNYDPAASAGSVNAARVTLSELPVRATFMAIGHCWWAMLLGVLGGWMAQFVYLRRVRENESLAPGRG